MIGVLACAGAMLLGQQAAAQLGKATERSQAPQSIRISFAALMDSYEQVFKQEGNARGQQAVANARAAMQKVNDDDLAHVLSKAGALDMTSAVAAIQRVAASDQQA